MAVEGRQKRSGLRGMFGMMKMMKNCMPGNEGSCDCAGIMDGSRPDGAGFDCRAMMKAMSGAESAPSGETAAKA